MTEHAPLFLRTRPARVEAVAAGPPWYPDPKRPGFERAIAFETGFGLDPAEHDKPTSQRYGRSAMSMRWLLRGPSGVTQFLMSTGWTPEYLPPDPRWPSLTEWMHHPPSAYDLGYHAYVPQYEGASQYGQQPCDYLGAPCWYDGSSLRAEAVLTAFFDRGEDGVWDALHSEHECLIGPEGTP